MCVCVHVNAFMVRWWQHGKTTDAHLRIYSATFHASPNEVQYAIQNHCTASTTSNKIKQRQRPDHKSFATDAVKRRLQLISTQLEGEAYYTINEIFNDEGKVAGTKVEIVWPLQ